MALWSCIMPETLNDRAAEVEGKESGKVFVVVLVMRRLGNLKAAWSNLVPHGAHKYSGVARKESQITRVR